MGFRKTMCNNTAFLCMNISQEQCDLAAMADGIIDLIIPVISTSLLLGLLLGLRREAWNTPLKRLSLLLCTFYGVNGLIFASVELYNDLLPEVWCKVFFFAVADCKCLYVAEHLLFVQLSILLCNSYVCMT